MIRSFVNQIKEVVAIQKSEYYFGFVNRHSTYFEKEIQNIALLLRTNSKDNIREKYEKKFSEIIGKGYALSFAAGRMAFYLLLKTLSIGKGDEILITGFTCSVMVNSIIKVGATPVYVDIDKNTFGTDSKDLNRKISKKTKLIVTQHSFGIPCDIIRIAEIAKRNKLFLVEDCALTLDSKISGKSVGNFSDAAIFSTDHSKPINTLIGGILFTRNVQLYKKLKENYSKIDELDIDHQKRLYKRLLFEYKYYNPISYKKTKVFLFYNKFRKKILLKKNKVIFLENEENAKPVNNKQSYPYPAKLPLFLAYVGIKELDNWNLIKDRRQKLLANFVNITVNAGKSEMLPKAYFDKNLEIVPHRFIICSNNKENFVKKVKNYLDTGWFWFEKPIVTTNCSLSEFGYYQGDCKISETIGERIINFPTDVSKEYEELLIDFFRKVVKTI